jgi:hypothetical protein
MVSTCGYRSQDASAVMLYASLATKDSRRLPKILEDPHVLRRAAEEARTATLLYRWQIAGPYGDVGSVYELCVFSAGHT